MQALIVCSDRCKTCSDISLSVVRNAYCGIRHGQETKERVSRLMNIQVRIMDESGVVCPQCRYYVISRYAEMERLMSEPNACEGSGEVAAPQFTSEGASGKKQRRQ